MDEEQVKNTMSTRSDDTNVPAMIASLENLTVETSSSSMETKRVLRKRIPKHVSTEISKGRYNFRPKKRTFIEMHNLEESVKDYYLDKNVQRKPNNLETIYEEIQESDHVTDKLVHMSSKRFKRMLLFKSEPTASKLKKRRAKIQKVFGSKNNRNRERTSLQNLLNKLDGITSNSPTSIDCDFK